MNKCHPWYSEYTRTKHWKHWRFLITHEIDFRCEICGRPQSMAIRLVLHHLTYERLGCEIREDLMLLCTTCHDLVDDADIPFKEVLYSRVPPLAVLKLIPFCEMGMFHHLLAAQQKSSSGA